MKKGTIFLVLIILILGAILGYKILNNKDTNNESGSEVYNIAEFVDYINSLNNVYVERRISNNIGSEENDYYVKMYIKDDKKKIVQISKTTEEIQQVVIYNFLDNTMITYKNGIGVKASNTTIGIKPSSATTDLNTYASVYSSDYKKVYSQTIDGREYIIGEFNIDADVYEGIYLSSVSPNERFGLNTSYFDKNTKLLVKSEYKSDKYTQQTNYDNIKLNVVTDDDFIIPSNVVIIDGY